MLEKGMADDSGVVDLRSDTVTRPVPGMRQAIAAAEVGDDVFGDDPTVLALQEKVAGILGKEAALFVPSGTMSNGIAVKVHTRPGDEIILESGCHQYNFALAASHLHTQQDPYTTEQHCSHWIHNKAALHCSHTWPKSSA